MLNQVFSKHCYPILIFFLLNLNYILSEILVYKNTSTDKVVRVITDYELNIGSEIRDDEVMAYIVSAEPENACNEIKPPPKDLFQIRGDNASIFNWYVLVDRDYCAMDKKLKNVKDAGYNGVIIYNARLSSNLNSPESYKFIVDIPVLLVTHIDGRQIKLYYTYDKGYFARFIYNSPFRIYPFLVPFLVIIGACIIVMISFMISQIIRCYNERKKRRRHRLAKRHLKKIPTINFKKGDHYEICAICLDEFQEGVKLRLLTCGHAYHLRCIDPWLTENRRNCPICKGKVVVPGITDSESENDADNEHNNNATERTPLLNDSQQGNASYTSNLIFPIRSRILNSSNNVPNNSNVVNNNFEINVNRSPSISIQSSSSIIPFRSNQRTRRNRSSSQVNYEINSPPHSVFDERPTTSRAINIEEGSRLFDTKKNISTIDVSTQQNVFENSLSTNQTPPNSTYGSTARRQDNIV